MTALLRPSTLPPGAPRTLLVIGSKRSGTSAVARMLQLLGVYMGDRADPVVIEDARLASALAPGSAANAPIESVVAVTADYDARFALWGFKTPGRNRAVLRGIGLLRNPQLVLVTRDPAATALRVAKQDGIGFQRAFLQASVRQFVLYLRARLTGKALLLVSYEKLLADPLGEAAELAVFCGIEPAEALLRRCAQSVAPRESAYASAWNRKPAGIGYVDHVDPGCIGGWAASAHDSEPVELGLYAGEQRIAVAIADLPRPDVRDSRLHRDGRCGFRFDLAGLAPLPAGTRRLSVRICDSGFELNNSPVPLP